MEGLVFCSLGPREALTQNNDHEEGKLLFSVEECSESEPGGKAGMPEPVG